MQLTFLDPNIIELIFGGLGVGDIKWKYFSGLKQNDKNQRNLVNLYYSSKSVKIFYYETIPPFLKIKT